MEKGRVLAYSEGQIGHIYIEGEIGPDFHKDVRAQLDSPQVKDATSLIVHITSPGGSVYAGYSIFNVLRSSGKPITSLIEGEAQSMATFISLAGSKKLDPKNGGIFIINPSTYMIHNPSIGLQGTADTLDDTSKELRNIEAEMAKAYSLQTGLPEEQMKAMMKKETRMNAMEALKAGFVDEVKNHLKAVALGKNMKDKKSLLNSITGMIAQALGEAPEPINLKLSNGKALSVTSEDENLVGKAATIEGVLASDGEYPLEDGRVVVVAKGVITEVKAAATKEDPTVALNAQIADLTSKLNAQTAAAQTAATEKEKITAEKQGIVQMLGKLREEVEELKKEPAGDQTNPNDMNTSHQRVPVGFGRTSQTDKALDMTRTWLMENMPSIEQHYPVGYFDKWKRGGPNAVSVLETNFNYTWPGILTTDLFYKPTMQAPALSDFAMIDQDIKFQKKYNLVTQLDKIVQPYTGCGGTVAGNRQLITNTTVQTKRFQVYESWCQDDFTGLLTGAFNLLAQEWLKTGLKGFDPAGTPIDTVIMTVLKDAIQRDIFRRVFFAAGNSSDADYNQFDGVWDRLIDSSGAANYCVRRAGSSIAGSLSGGNALTHLGTAYAAAKPILKNNRNAKFFVTRSIWDNYYDSLIGNGAVTEQAFKNLQAGVNGNPSEPPKALTYKGYEVVPVDLWDEFLTETDNPLYSGGSQRNLILFTVKDNHIIGVENGSDLNKIESFYENKDQKRYYRSQFALGYNYLHCDLQVIMY